MSDVNRGMDWARVPQPEQVAIEARATRAKLRIEWVGDDSGWVVAEFDGLDFRRIGEIVFDWQHGWFFFPHEPDPNGGTKQVQGDPPNYGRELIDVDPDARLTFNNELVEAGRTMGALRDVRMAELRGRLNMHRDDTRQLAEIGAKVFAKRWLPTYLTFV